MKVAYFGNDWFLGCIDVIRQQQHKISHIFTNNVRPFNEKLRRLAFQEKIPLVTTQLSSNHIQNLLNEGVELIFSIEYGWKIPLPSNTALSNNEVVHQVKTINVHPTILPEGRGPSPLPWILLKYPDCAGITLHKLSADFDQGDIVYQKSLKINDDETFETLLAKLEKQIPEALESCLESFEHYYQNAQAQHTGSYWPKIENKHRLVDWQQSVNDIKKLSRAFGQNGIIIPINQELVVAKNVVFTNQSHKSADGEIIDNTPTHYIIAAKDGTLKVPKTDIITVLDTLN